jgi:hypothetical protein
MRNRLAPATLLGLIHTNVYVHKIFYVPASLVSHHLRVAAKSTAANVIGVTQAEELPHGKETHGWTLKKTRRTDM